MNPGQRQEQKDKGQNDDHYANHHHHLHDRRRSELAYYPIEETNDDNQD